MGLSAKIPARGVRKLGTVTFDVASFEDAVNDQGVTLVHYRVLRCPVGLVDIGDNRRPHDDCSACVNGFILTKVGRIKGVISSNGDQTRETEAGWIDDSTVQCTFNRYYLDSILKDSEDIRGIEGPYIAQYDRFYLDEEALTVPTSELFEAHATGRDRLQFPAVAVDDLVDSNGRFYKEGVHFSVKNGWVVWTGPERPSFDPDAGKGQICSVRYRLKPYWVAGRLGHEIRVANVDNVMTGVREVVRMPQQATLVREYVSLDNTSDKKTPRSPREPAQGSFGPR